MLELKKYLGIIEDYQKYQNIKIWSAIHCNPKDIIKIFDDLPQTEIGTFCGIKVLPNTILPSDFIVLESKMEMLFINLETGRQFVIDKINFKIKSTS